MDWSSLSNTSSSFLPHGYCLLWQPGLLWTLVSSDAIIAASYFSIPLSLGLFLHKQRQIQFRGVVYMFMAFILACGITHLIEIANIWRPLYGLSASVKAATAIISVVTAIALWHLMPLISEFLDRHRELNHELEQRNRELKGALQLAREREIIALEKERLFRLTQSKAPIGIATASTDGRFISVNKALADMLGYSQEELLSLSFQDITHPQDLEKDLAEVGALLAGLKNSYRMEKRYFARDGSIIQSQLNVSLLRDEAGTPQAFIKMIQDITPQKRNENALKRSRAKFQRLLENIPTAIVVHEDVDHIQYANSAAFRLLGLQTSLIQNTLQDKACCELTDENGESLQPDQFPATRVFRNGESIHDETVGINKFGQPMSWAQVNAFSIPNESGSGQQVVISFTDITDRKTQADRLETQAMTDALTGLYNRRYCMSTLETELERSKRYDNKLSVVMLDVDHFKQVNDQHGHEIGDKVLALLGDLCNQVLRKQDIACRLGGEEFALILPDSDIQMAHDAAERLRVAVEDAVLPLESGQSLHWTISLGIASAFTIDDPNSLLKRADEALYAAKHSGRNRVITEVQASGKVTRLARRKPPPPKDSS